MLMSKSRLEKFLYALYSLDSSDLPAPLSRIEELYKCWVAGEEVPTFKPLSRVEKYLMAILGVYNVDELPNPLSRVEVLLYKLATGDDNLDDVKSFLSEHEELLAEIIRNGGVGGDIDIEYVLYTLSTKSNTLYNTAEKPVKSAILKGQTLVNANNPTTIDINNRKVENGWQNFEGMQSVKMPVLKTTGKNLFPTNNFIECGIDNIMVGQYNFDIYLKSGNYYISFVHADDSDKNTWFRCDMIDEQKNQVLGLGTLDRTFTIEKDGLYKLKTGRGSAFNNTCTKVKVQIEEGDTATEYEPYKSNILTTNEEVTLRGIGDVKDELDLLTGEKVERVGEVVLDGSEDITQRNDIQLTDKIAFEIINIFGFNTAYLMPMICNNFNVYYVPDDKELMRPINGSDAIVINISTSKCNDLDSFKVWLSQNPVTVQYQLATESVKTVDLSVVNQDGNSTKLNTFNDITHVTLSSEGLIPEAELEVATKNEEVLNTMNLEMNDISKTQNDLQETLDIQSENVDSTMIATTEIYEGLL